MGYYANGSGYISVRADERKVDEIMNVISENLECDKMQGFEEGVTDISVWASEKYYDDEMWEMLNKIQAYTTDGYIQYIGEDDTIWRFYFDKESKEWKDENGTIVFPSTPQMVPDEIREKIIEEYKFQQKKQYLLDILYDKLDGKVDKEKLPDIAESAVEVFERYLDKNDPYWDAYYECANFALDDILAEEEDM